MLSAHSFNALLKTLEEPPPHVKFLLATTDPQKLPVTVLSRCLQFNLKRLPLERIAERMGFILQQESVHFESAALHLLAEAADGSLRDGLSLLDQLIAFGGGSVTETAARAMLATVDRRQVVRLVELLADANPAALLTYAQELEAWAPDYAEVLDAVATLLVRIALAQAVPGYPGDELHPPELIAPLAARISPEDVQLYYQTAILGRRDLVWAPDPRTGFEMTLLRMLAFRPGNEETNSSATPRPIAAAPRRGTQVESAQTVAPGDDPTRWAQILGQLELGGAARQLAAHCVYAGREGQLLRLTLDPAQALLRTPALIDKLAQALGRHLGESLRLEIELGTASLETPARAEQREAQATLEAARESLEQDPTVRGFKEKFGAVLKPDSVRPKEE